MPLCSKHTRALTVQKVCLAVPGNQPREVRGSPWAARRIARNNAMREPASSQSCFPALRARGLRVRLAAALGADADTHDFGGIESAVRTYKDILGTHIRTHKDILGTHRLPLALTPTPMTLAAL